jgi:hypothetical protein
VVTTRRKAKLRGKGKGKDRVAGGIQVRTTTSSHSPGAHAAHHMQRITWNEDEPLVQAGELRATLLLLRGL